MPPANHSNLATAKTLTATQIPGRVVLKATGDKPTLQHEVRFQDTPDPVFPPPYLLVLVPPSGISTPVVTPFEAETFFAATDPVASVKITDSRGTHTVPVDQAQD